MGEGETELLALAFPPEIRLFWNAANRSAERRVVGAAAGMGPLPRAGMGDSALDLEAADPTLASEVRLGDVARGLESVLSAKLRKFSTAEGLRRGRPSGLSGDSSFRFEAT